MSRRVRIVLAAALAVGATIIGTMGSGTAQAGEPADLNVTVYVNAPDAMGLLGDLTPEFYPDSGEPDTSCAMGGINGNLEGFFASSNYGCPDVPKTGVYQVGLDGAPPTAIVSADCYATPKEPVIEERIEGPNSTFTLDGNQTVQCYIYVDVPAVIIDKTVLDGPASVDEFDVEIYGDPGDIGGPDAGSLVATTSDPDVANCYLGDVADCAVVFLDPGSYQLGEVPALGYLATNVYCIPIYTGGFGERFPGAAGTFTLGGGFNQKALSEIQVEQQSLFAYCEIENSHYEGDIVVEKVVVNDDGGTAKAEDFKAEVYLESDGSLATSAQCVADGSCIDEALPIGEYRVGESGPSGYTASVVCEVTVEPDTPGLGTVGPTLPPWYLPIEALSGDAALFELEPSGEARCVITNNDNPVPTTTTTTVAPTTTDQAQVPPQLPATGGDSDSLGLIAALGALMLLMGGTLLVARRRT